LPVEGKFKERLKNMTPNLTFFDSLCRYQKLDNKKAGLFLTLPFKRKWIIFQFDYFLSLFCPNPPSLTIHEPKKIMASGSGDILITPGFFEHHR
jgi:hypothetical protein